MTSDIDEIVRPRRQRRRRRKKRRFGSFVAVVLSLAVISAVGAGLYYGGNAVIGALSGAFGEAEDYPGPGSGEVSVTIEPGDSVRAMGATLYDAGVVASEDAFLEAADANPEATTIQPGTYVLAREMRAADALAVLIDGEGSRQRVSLPEGLRVRQTVERLAEESGLAVKALRQAVDNAELPPYAEGKPEGFLFPAAYDLGTDVTAASLVADMIGRFTQTAENVNLVQGAAKLDMTPREVVTVASIVQREVRNAEDMPRAAEVIYNRLSGACEAHGVPDRRLQMDSTVHYALDDYSSVFNDDEARSIDSPYNTYVHSGLPPGPIASPGEAALAAALTPSTEGNCYFVTVNLETGETKFAQTSDQHDEFVQQLRAYCRESDLC